MENQKKLLFARNIFTFLVVISLSIIIVVEKRNIQLSSKVEKQFEEYINTKYPEIKDDIKLGEISYKDNTFSMKITSKDNDNLYFFVQKKKKEITDTYQTDYYEGKSLFETLPKKLEKEIKEITHTTIEVKMVTTLDQHIKSIQERIIKEENLTQLKFYTIERTILIEDWNKEKIAKTVAEEINVYANNHITPKSYTIILINKQKIKESIQINNLTEDYINNPKKVQIIEDILKDTNSQLLKENNITYKYINKEEK